MSLPVQRWRIGLALLVAIATVRVSLAMYAATPLPFYDEWPAMIDQIARPMLAHTLHPGMLLATHNEHVLAPTRLLEWSLLRANDVQYDNTQVCALNQILRAALAATLIVLALPAFARMPRLFAGAAAAFAAIPYDWENIGMGFANSYFLLVGFSVFTIVAAARMQRIVSGALALSALALLADVSMGSGFFAAGIGFLIVAVRWRRRDLAAPAALVFAVMLAICTGVGVALTWRATGAASIGALQALQIALALLAWIPTGVLGWSCLRSRTPDRCALALFGVSLWGLVEILAIIAMRPEFRLWLPISRYMEILGVAAFANLGCLLRAARHAPLLRLPVRWALPAFAGAIVLGAPYATAWFDWHAGELSAQAQRLRQYVREGNFAVLADAPAVERAYPSLEYLHGELDAADVRQILGDQYGTRPRPAVLTAAWRGLGAGLGAWRWPIWLIAVMLSWLLVPSSWRRVRCATIQR